jgi:hypothetical protein
MTLEANNLAECDAKLSTVFGRLRKCRLKLQQDKFKFLEKRSVTSITNKLFKDKGK